MVQNKQKSNKTNIIALLSSFLVAFVFVFWCVEYAHAETTDTYVYGEDSYKYINDSRSHFVAFCLRNMDRYNTIFLTNFYGRVAALRETENVNGSMYYVFRLYTKSSNNDVSIMVYNTCSYPKNGKYESSFASFSGPFDSDISGYSTSYKIDDGELIYSGICIFDNSENLNNYLDTGEINNAIYQPEQEIEYDSDIEVPLNLDIQLNGSSNFVPNVKITCNQSEYLENRVLEVSYSIGYRATWCLMGGIGLNIKSKTSPVVYGSVEQLEEYYDNSSTSFEQLISLSKLSLSKQPDKSAFDSYKPSPSLYWSLKEIKNQDSEMKIWVRNRVGNKCSKWVMVSGDSYKASFDVVDSDENGSPTDTMDKEANDSTGYGSDYWNNRDITPNEDISSGDAISNIKSLKSNYSSLIAFFKELFSFLPVQIWALLIGLVGAMVVIALLMFIRG